MTYPFDEASEGRIHDVTAMVEDGQAVLICSCDDSACAALDVAAKDLAARGLIEPLGREREADR